ncbi:Hydroxysteroid dehydrogenase-like protein 2 [Paramyrothecium foliicola]|nr:Hydroxysteroid dehydrogenase-like protein 2 [Paramyrothecium foliicola]
MSVSQFLIDFSLLYFNSMGRKLREVRKQVGKSNIAIERSCDIVRSSVARMLRWKQARGEPTYVEIAIDSSTHSCYSKAVSCTLMIACFRQRPTSCETVRRDQDCASASSLIRHAVVSYPRFGCPLEGGRSPTTCSTRCRGTWPLRAPLFTNPIPARDSLSLTSCLPAYAEQAAALIPFQHYVVAIRSSGSASIYSFQPQFHQEKPEEMPKSSKPVALVVGASRGIGRQVAVDLAANVYAVVVAAKTLSDPSKPTRFPPSPNSPESTITTVTREIVEAGGDAVAIQVDVRDPASVNSLVERTISVHQFSTYRFPSRGLHYITTSLATYGRLDVLIYNSGAIFWAPVSSTPLKRFQLMQRVNPEGLYAVVQAALPHLRQPGSSGRIIVVSPPIYSRFFRGKTAYAMGKIGMSVLTKGLAMDIERDGLAHMAITSIWPAVAIESAATDQFTRRNPSEAQDLRKPTIFSDAIIAILQAPPSKVNGELLLDEDFLRDHAGVASFDKYSVIAGSSPRRIMPMNLPDLTVAEQADEGKRYDSTKQSKL